MTTGVAELKSKLSHYLAMVQKGKQVIVTSHGHSIARLVPVESTGSDLKIAPARRPVSTLKRIKGLKLKVDLVADLFADRRGR